MAAPAIVLQQIQVAGGNLFQIAAQYLGDATQWNRIAALNGLYDPMITGTVTLLLPPYNPNAGNGGILGL
jgi:nucleoid-associated protein YgaU